MKFINKLKENITVHLRRWGLLKVQAQDASVDAAQKQGAKPVSQNDTSEKAPQDYFELSESWFDDVYTNTLISRRRYQWAFFASFGLCGLLSIALAGLSPLVRVETQIIHHYSDGTIEVEAPKAGVVNVDEEGVENDVVRYVVLRESYDKGAFPEHYRQVNHLSNREVASQYRLVSQPKHPDSLMATLGENTTRVVHVEHLEFLDKESVEEIGHHNLVKVFFTLTDNNPQAGTAKVRHRAAIMSWHYRGVPKRLEERAMNPNGFVITDYSVETRRVNG